MEIFFSLKATDKVNDFIFRDSFDYYNHLNEKTNEQTNEWLNRRVGCYGRCRHTRTFIISFHQLEKFKKLSQNKNIKIFHFSHEFTRCLFSFLWTYSYVHSEIKTQNYVHTRVFLFFHRRRSPSTYAFIPSSWHTGWDVFQLRITVTQLRLPIKIKFVLRVVSII